MQEMNAKEKRKINHKDEEKLLFSIAMNNCFISYKISLKLLK